VSSIGFGDETKAITYPQFEYEGSTNTTLGAARVYRAGDDSRILVTEQGVVIGHPQKGFVPIEKIATERGYLDNPINATKSPGAVLIAQNMALYIAPEAEDILFTKLYLLGGSGLENFKPVFNNGYIKTYEADYT
jgi:hypothetical protein